VKGRWYYVKTIVVLLILASFAAMGCHKKAVNPFPESGKVTGWQKSGETRSFDAANLWQYIDGDSEQYIRAGVVTTSTSDYKSEKNLEATVDVYTMKTPDGARKIFEVDPQSGAATPKLGDAARAYEQSVIFRKGRYLVRIVAYEAAPQSRDALLALAHGVEARL
jgi:Family of unknown function (DUF6599)